MVFKRQKLLLALLDARASPIDEADFHNLLFLYTLDFNRIPRYYDFVPYAGGRFSFTARADKQHLIQDDGLLHEGSVWRITPAGRALARSAPEFALSAAWFIEHHRDLNGASLAAAVRSRAGEEAMTAVGSGLLTIGYEGKSLEAYLNQLLQAGVTLLCDVRRNAFSRKYGFSKSTLATACTQMGIKYVHLPKLGVAAERRRQLADAADRDRLFAEYIEYNLPQQRQLLRQIARWVKEEDQRVALTCFESDPDQCHRHCVAAALAAEGLAPTHL
ncbi:MAG TPA: DUF488 domain-containing protein [Gammaproteobacteria bacterium]